MNPYLYSGPKSTLATIERLMKLIPAARWDERLHPNRFTPREVVAHLADWEPIFLERILGAVEVEGYVVTPLDEDERARTHRYHEKDVPGSLQRFRAARERTLEVVQGLSDDQLARRLTHPERGEMWALDLVQMLAGHDAYHIEQLSEYLEEAAVGTW